jgi:hypothetical protein
MTCLHLLLRRTFVEGELLVVDILSKNLYDKFLLEYYTVHPHGNDTSGADLYFVLEEIMYEFKSLADENEVTNNTFNDFYAGLYKVYWLFHNINLRLFYAQLRSFIIERNDTTLSETDYALLFYVSLQDEEIQNTAGGLPLSMLYDMFIPVAEDKLNIWKANLENKS